MKKIALLSVLLLGLSLLGGCARDEANGCIDLPAPPSTSPGQGQAEPAGTLGAAPAEDGDWTLTQCRIISGAETGDLILAGAGDNEVYTLKAAGLAVTMDGGSSGVSELRDGMTVFVGHTGMILETFPAQFADPKSIAGDSSGVDDRCGLYLQVLEDLWAVDNGLNEGILQLGVDLSELTDLTASEKSAVAYAFGMAHGMMPIEGTWQELVDEGYITGEPLEGSDAVFYEWTDGILFSLTGSAEESFTAEKWRSGLGAYFFSDCTAQMEADGAWSYTVGAELMA